jgi:hypothetical protein
VLLTTTMAMAIITPSSTSSRMSIITDPPLAPVRQVVRAVALLTPERAVGIGDVVVVGVIVRVNVG